MKKETLEEAIVDHSNDATQQLSFLNGSEWQQKNSYSEEEVIKILYQFHYDLVNSNFDTKEEWFEQFKK